MQNIISFEDFNISEARTPGGKKVNKKYLTAPTAADKKRMKEEIDKHSDKSDDDPSAYKKWPADHKGGKVSGDAHDTKPSAATIAYHKKYKSNESESWETGLKNKSDDTGIPLRFLKRVYNKGLAAWKTGHRPGASQHQWAMGRVNSWITGSGGARKADKDVWDDYQEWKKKNT